MGTRMWGGKIERDYLLRKISLLALLGGVREGVQVHPLASSSAAGHVLTVEQEAEITSNLAFLARRHHDPKSVAAIGVEVDEDGQGMVIRLCVNGDALSRVENGLKEICGTLEQISQQKNTEAHDIDVLLQKIVELDFSRISSLLKVTPKYTVEASPITQLYQSFKKRPNITAQLRESMEALAGLFNTLKAFPDILGRQGLVKEIVVLAYDLTQSDEFRTTVASIANGSKLGDTIAKLGQYRRAARQLVLTARRKKYQIFRKVRVCTFQTDVPDDVKVPTTAAQSMPFVQSVLSHPDMARLLTKFQGSKSLGTALTKRLNNERPSIKVHAEIKLLFFYITHSEIRRPRILAANKSSCYL